MGTEPVKNAGCYISCVLLEKDKIFVHNKVTKYNYYRHKMLAPKIQLQPTSYLLSLKIEIKL